jgi:hypothetical protein
MEDARAFAQDLGKRITTCMTERNLPIRTMCQVLHEVLGLNSNTAEIYVSSIRKGFAELHGYRLSEEWRQRKLHRIAHILNYLEVPADDPLIARMQAIDPSVSYPPTMPVPRFCP